MEPGPAIANRTPIFSLLGANGVSQVGNTVLLVAVPWFVLETTGSAARTGLAAAAIGVGAVVPVVLGGTLMDRLGFKRASVLADLTSGATVAAIPLLYLTGVLAFWQLLVLLFLIAGLNTNGDTARFSLIPSFARRATMPIERARALHRVAVRALLVAMDRRGTRIPFGALESLQRATALGRIDLWVVKGWGAPEELLYPQMQEALTGWTRANRPRHEVVRVVGERWSPRSHELRDSLARNTVPFGFYAADSEEGRRLLRDHDVDAKRLPAVILHDGSVLQEPTLVDIAHALGVHTRPSFEVYDLAILGAGPAGLAAAVYGASEGLSTLVIEQLAIGGQAGTSSMIRNYLGFPRGVGGGELAHQAWEQAVLFGAQFVFTQPATGLATCGRHHMISLSDGSEVVARAVIIAVGVAYRRLGIPALERLVGVGVFYGPAGVEAPAMAGEEVYVVGGANSAGQAALHLARFAARVTLLVRGESLAAGMSDYLIRQIEATPNVEVRLRTRVADGRGEMRLETLTLEEVRTGLREEVAGAAVFVLIGAEPRTEWRRDVIRRDEHGFILTGRDIPQEAWPSKRPPLPFETNIPGVFAAGDVRHGSLKRVAGSVGEGSVTVGSVHRYLSEGVVGGR